MSVTINQLNLIINTTYDINELNNAFKIIGNEIKTNPNGSYFNQFVQIYGYKWKYEMDFIDRYIEKYGSESLAKYKEAMYVFSEPIKTYAEDMINRPRYQRACEIVADGGNAEYVKFELPDGKDDVLDFIKNIEYTPPKTDYRVSLNDEINRVDRMDGYEFENYCALLLRIAGFQNVRVTQESNDHGIDILTDDYAIQCKRYKGNVGNSAVQQAYSGRGIYGKLKAAVLTNQFFTSNAINEARQLGVELWDRNTLIELIKPALFGEHGFAEMKRKEEQKRKNIDMIVMFSVFGTLSVIGTVIIIAIILYILRH